MDAAAEPAPPVVEPLVLKPSRGAPDGHLEHAPPLDIMQGRPWLLVHGDCLDNHSGLLQLGPLSVDHVLVDPPFSKHVHANQRPTVKGNAFARKSKLNFQHLHAKHRAALCEHYARIARRWVIIFSDVESTYLWRRDAERAGLRYVREGAWIQEGHTPQKTGDRPAQGHEPLLIFHRADVAMRWNGGGRSAIYHCPIVTGRDPAEPRHHPTQKPLGLMTMILNDFSDRGDLILDSHAGFATTLAASVKMGRRAIGWERRGEFHERASWRMGGAIEQLDLLHLLPEESGSGAQ